MAHVVYRFDRFRIDVAARELFRDEHPIPLPASVFDCLTYLLDNRDRAVGRDELIAAVWGRTDVTDTVLGQTILKARRALDDTGNAQHTIRTVPRFGYRWIAKVEQVSEQEPEPAMPPTPSSGDPVPAGAASANDGHGRLGSYLIIAVGVLVLSVLVALLGSREPRDRGATAASETPAAEGALVLPARVRAPEEDWSWLRLGVMDLVAERLKRAGMSTVASESVVALARAGDGALPALTDPDLAAFARWRIQPEIWLERGRWRVALEAASDHQRISVDAEGGDVVQTARSAVDALLHRLDLAPPASDDEPPALDELLQRTRAAMLADQFELARALIREAPGELREQPELVHRLSQIELRAGRYRLVQQLLEGLLDRLPALEYPVLRGKALITLAASYVRRNQPDPAERAYEEAIELLRSQGEPAALGLAYLGRGLVAAMHARLDEAAAELGRARIEMQAAGDALGMAQVDLNLGMFDQMRQRPADALAKLTVTAERFRTLGSREELVYAMSRITEIHNRLLDHRQALAVSETYWPAEASSGNERLRWDLTLSRARALMQLGRLAEARGLLLALRQHADPDLDRKQIAGATASQAELELLAGDAALALDLAGSALSPALAETDPLRYLRTARVQRQAASTLDSPESRAIVDRLTAWADGLATPRAPLIEAHLRLAQAEQAAAEKRWPEANQWFGQAIEIAEAVAVPDDLVEIAHRFTLALIDQDDLVRAQSVAGRIAPWADRDFRAAQAESCLFAALSLESAWQQARQRLQALAGERLLADCRPGQPRRSETIAIDRAND